MHRQVAAAAARLQHHAPLIEFAKQEVTGTVARLRQAHLDMANRLGLPLKIVGKGRQRD